MTDILTELKELKARVDALEKDSKITLEKNPNRAAFGQAYDEQYQSAAQWLELYNRRYFHIPLHKAVNDLLDKAGLKYLYVAETPARIEVIGK